MDAIASRNPPSIASNPDNTVETLWSSKEENVYDLLALEKQILFSTDSNGRIYGLAPDRRVTLVAQTNEGETTRLLPSDHSVLAATSNMAASTGWGKRRARAALTKPPCTIPHRVALGQSELARGRARRLLGALPHALRQLGQTDRTWSDWSEPLADASGSRIASPNARYIQWKANCGHGGTPLLDSSPWLTCRRTRRRW